MTRQNQERPSIYTCMHPYLIKAGDPHASREDDDDVPEWNRRGRDEHRDPQEHRNQPRRADALDAAHRSVRLFATMQVPPCHKGATGHQITK